MSVGTLIGVLPGIGPLATIAMLLPITFNVAPVGALIMLAGIYYGAQYGGSTTAILVNLPGETSAVVTCIDGYQMARQGRAGPALAIAAHRLVLRRHRRHAADRAVRPAARRDRAEIRRAGIFLADADGPGRRRGAGAGRHDEVARHGGRWACCSASSAPTSTPACSASRFGITELSDGIGFIVVAVGVFAIGEIIANLGDPEERTRLHRQGDRT